VRNCAAIVSGFANLISEEVAESSSVVDEHVERLAANVDAMRRLLESRPPAMSPARRGERRPRLAPVRPLRSLLVVEDDDDHFYLLRSLLSRHGRGGPWRLLRARTLAEARTILATQEPACSLIDLHLPDSDQLDTLSQLRAAAPFQPMIVVTGAEPTSGLDAVRMGAQDYLVKGNLSGELVERAVEYAIERARFEAALVHQALHDPVTGLANRSLLFDRLSLALARLDRHSSRVGLLFIDLDRFKILNDSLGHQIGDELLTQVGLRLMNRARRTDTVARVGGDEFVVLIEDLADGSEAARIAEQILAMFDSPFPCSAGPQTLSASIGVAITDTGDISPQMLIANADTAMYRAKERGRRRWELFDQDMRNRLVNLFCLEQELAGAHSKGQLEVWYQPVVDIGTGRTIGAEALLRWNHPLRGLLSPADFLQVAEETGQIIDIGAWVLREACEQAQRWSDDGVVEPGFVMWANVSSRQFERPGDLERTVVAALGAGSGPWVLGLEITETTVLQDVEQAGAVLADLRALGTRIAIDDFGTGFSSLRWLQRLPIDRLKIDANFVAGVSDRGADRAIVAACLGLGEALGLGCTAEGVETANQLEILTQMGCQAAQGHLLGMPSPAARALRRATGDRRH